MIEIKYYFFEPNIELLFGFIGVALLYCISLLNFNYVLQFILSNLKKLSKLLYSKVPPPTGGGGGGYYIVVVIFCPSYKF